MLALEGSGNNFQLWVGVGQRWREELESEGGKGWLD